MTLESKIRNHIDESASPIRLDEILDRASGPDFAALAEELLAGQPVDDLPGLVDLEPSERSVTEISHRSSRHLFQLAAAALVVAGLGGALLQARQSGRSEIEAATPSSTVPSSLEELHEVLLAADAITIRGWTQLPDPGEVFIATAVDDAVELSPLGAMAFGQPPTGTRTRLEVRDIEHLSSGYYAVGAEANEVVSVGAIWQSNDAKSWTRVEDTNGVFSEFDVGESHQFYPWGVRLSSIVERDSTIVAVGAVHLDQVTPFAWVKAGDEPWQRLALPHDNEGSLEMHAVVSSASGFIAVGSALNFDYQNDAGPNYEVLVWTSPDGLRWTQTGATGFEPANVVSDVVLLGERLVAVGAGSGYGSIAASWYSDDKGQTWNRAEFPSGQDFPGPADLLEVAVGPQGLMAIGTKPGSTGRRFQRASDGSIEMLGNTGVGIWTSVKGFGWEEVSTISDPDRHIVPMSVVWGPAGFLITAVALDGDSEETQSWVTSTGDELYPANLERSGSPSSPGSAVAQVATDAGYIILADPEFGSFIRLFEADFDAAYRQVEGEAPHHLEVWELSVG